MAISLGQAVIWGFSYIFEFVEHLQKLKDLSQPKKGFADSYVQRKAKADQIDKQKALEIAESLAMVLVGAAATMISSGSDTTGDDRL